MIKVENIDVWGFEGAIRGLRNPMNSWDKSDTIYGEFHGLDDNGREIIISYNPPEIGQQDLSLMHRLYKAGTEHRTYARMIQVSMDITAPLYWWKEMDRYTVGKSQVSCSTMHKIAAKEFELDDFSHEHLIDDEDEMFSDEELFDYTAVTALNALINNLNFWRNKYLKHKDKKYWWQLIQLLPSSYNQKRTICMSYETVFKIIKERTGHKLDEWNDFVKILKEELPYVKEIIGDEKTS